VSSLALCKPTIDPALQLAAVLSGSINLALRSEEYLCSLASDIQACLQKYNILLKKDILQYQALRFAK